jgi:ribosomal protein L11 methylase PrmA
MMKTKKMSEKHSHSSFRDPSGFIFTHNGVLYRQINECYAKDFTRLMQSGLYEKLVKAGLLVPHTETDLLAPEPGLAFKVIQPERVPFISYPYEWSFSMLKDAALATLSIQKRALKAAMSLKDASAYNIQFFNGKPTLIDTLSFEEYREGSPWSAYRQFCQHFLAPLALMVHTDIRLNQLLRVYIDGIPLDLASRLLPLKTRFNFGLLTHIHLHAQAQKRYAGKPVSDKQVAGGMNRQSFTGLIESLEATIRKLEWKPSGTAWGDYYNITNYSDAAFLQKKELISTWATQVKPGLIWDLGGNTGIFSRMASREGAYTVSFDIDPAAVETNYIEVKNNKEKLILPLVLDLTNPSPAIGWDNLEREAFGERGPADLVMALALIHHLVIGNNVPLNQAVSFFQKQGNWLIIEFIPKDDSQVQLMLQSRKDIFSEYNQAQFEAEFSKYFDIREKVNIEETVRILYLMQSKG